jgi:hypothetical protein
MHVAVQRLSRTHVRVSICVGDLTITIDYYLNGAGGFRGILSRQPHYS